MLDIFLGCLSLAYRLETKGNILPRSKWSKDQFTNQSNLLFHVCVELFPAFQEIP